MSHVVPRPKFVGEGSTARTGAFTVLSLSLKLRGVQAPLRSRSQISPHTQQSGVSSAVVGHCDGRPVPEQRPRSEPSPSPVPRRPEGARRPRGPPRPGLAGEPAPPADKPGAPRVCPSRHQTRPRRSRPCRAGARLRGRPWRSPRGMQTRKPPQGQNCGYENRGIVSRLPHANSDGLSVPVRFGFPSCPAVPPAPALTVGGRGVLFQAIPTPSLARGPVGDRECGSCF